MDDAARNDEPGKPDDRLSEDAVALEFARRNRDWFRFDHERDAWFEWDGSHWRKETTGKAYSLCREIAREMSEHERRRDQARMRRSAFVGGAERMARSDRDLAVTQTNWDNHPLLLGCPGTTINLCDGTGKRPDPLDGITKQTAVAPADVADCPLWIRFLREVTGDDPAMMRFLQQVCGYALTGDTREHALFFVYGPGGNGKSVFINTIFGILRDYATTASMDTFTASRSDRHPADLATLRGARLVTASESEEGRALAESRIKMLTGGDPITARFMRQDFFTFRPTFKLVFSGNHKPVLCNVDDAARRRLNIIPFVRNPEHPDPMLEQKLQAEWPKILRWMIDGALDWQANGLIRPPAVVAETEAYLEAQDIFGQWLEDQCVVEIDSPHHCETAGELFTAWREYAEARGENPGTQKSFGDRMSARGFKSTRRRYGGKQQRCWLGLNLSKIAADHSLAGECDGCDGS